MEPHFRSFEEFWPFYVKEHQNKTNRLLHFAGTSTALALLTGAVLFRKPRLLLLVPVVGYGAAWAGHFFVEGNRPATFRHPLWSLRGDFEMWWKIVNGKMDEEVARILRDEPHASDAAAPAASARSNESVT